MRTTWVGALCSAKHRSSFREVTARSMSKQWVWKPCFGVWASVLDHKCPFWSQLYFKPSWESIFYMAFFQAVVCKSARTHHKKLTSKPLPSPFCFLILPCVNKRKHTNWRSNKNNEHSVLRPGLLGCFIVHENHQTRMDKMSLELYFAVKKKKEKGFFRLPKGNLIDLAWENSLCLFYPFAGEPCVFGVRAGTC